MRRAIREVAASREVREAVASQTAGFADELAAEVRRWARRLDARLDRHHASATPYAGLATRAIALTLDALLIVAVFTALSGFVALITSLVGTLRPAWLVGTLLGVGWGLVAGVYLVFFWSAAGSTPGMHLLRVRVRDGSGGRPSVPRAILRTLATWISIVPLFAGYLPVLFDRRRRGLPDLVAAPRSSTRTATGRGWPRSSRSPPARPRSPGRRLPCALRRRARRRRATNLR